MMTPKTAEEAGTELLETIKSCDALKSLTLIQQFKEMMHNQVVGGDYVVWISEPANLTRVHQALADNLQVPPRLLAIRRVSRTRTQKALILITAMEIALKRIYQK